MIRTRFFGALCFFVFASTFHFAVAEPSCSAQLYRGEAPRISNAKLAAQTYPLCFSEIALLYSGVARTPLWSAERLTAERVRQARALPRLRANAFHEEPTLPVQDRAELGDYRRSGFDRGHMAPNGDMSTPQAQEESFSLANMIPQDPCNNEVLWEGIESAVRDLALSTGEVYVVTGPASRSVELKSLKGRVLVPTHIFKAVYVPSRNEAAAYFAPNDGSQTFDTLSIAALRSKIGIDVFPALDEEVKGKAMILPEPTPHFGCRVQTTEASSAKPDAGQR
jgi:endonuclease G